MGLWAFGRIVVHTYACTPKINSCYCVRPTEMTGGWLEDKGTRWERMNTVEAAKGLWVYSVKSHSYTPKIRSVKTHGIGSGILNEAPKFLIQCIWNLK